LSPLKPSDPKLTPRRRGGWPMLIAAGLILGAALPVSAQFEPDLGQTLDWIQSTRPGTPEIPEDAYELTRHRMKPEPEMLELTEVPGKPFRVVDPPPLKHDYHNYPIYVALGLPRDMVDAVFGFVGFIPIVNLAVVGVGYELVPTQVLVRDHRDWHGWGGTRNKNGHGWIDSESWGWFPSLNQTEFKSVDKRRLARYQAENAQLTAELQGLNREITAHNEAIRSRQKSAINSAVYWMEQGDAREAVSWILPAHRAYPLEEEIQGVLVAALAMYADDPRSPAWVEPLLWDRMMGAVARVQRAAARRIEAVQGANPEAYTPARALVFIRTAMGDRAGALRAAQSAYEVEPGDMRRARLLFEAAMTVRNEDQAEEALDQLEELSPERPGIELMIDQIQNREDGLELMRLRMALLTGDIRKARSKLRERVEGMPANAYYHYYLACAELGMLSLGSAMDTVIESAGTHFEQASLLAPNDPLRLRSRMGMTYVQSLASPGRPPEERPQGGFSGLSF
jgi:tetratricopeptide (TPR) repeat protein